MRNFFIPNIEFPLQVNEEHVGLVMEALSHRRAEVTDMGPVPGNDDRTRLSLTCPSRLLFCSRNINILLLLIELKISFWFTVTKDVTLSGI